MTIVTRIFLETKGVNLAVGLVGHLYVEAIYALKSGFGIDITGTDPLVLDLDGDGLELTRLEDSNLYFNLDNDDFPEKAAWVDGDDGLLARDLNAYGATGRSAKAGVAPGAR